MFLVMKFIMILLFSMIVGQPSKAEQTPKTFKEWKIKLEGAGFSFSNTNQEEKIEKAYRTHSLRWTSAFEYLLATDFEKAPIGTVDLLEKECYVTISEYLPKTEELGNIESHEVYTDIQMVIIGEEKMGLVGNEEVEVTRPYNLDRDVAFYKSSNVKYFIAPRNKIFIFMPNEIHQPGVVHANNQTIKKMVIKIKN